MKAGRAIIEVDELRLRVRVEANPGPWSLAKVCRKAGRAHIGQPEVDRLAFAMSSFGASAGLTVAGDDLHRARPEVIGGSKHQLQGPPVDHGRMRVGHIAYVAEDLIERLRRLLVDAAPCVIQTQIDGVSGVHIDDMQWPEPKKRYALFGECRIGFEGNGPIVFDPRRQRLAVQRPHAPARTELVDTALASPTTAVALRATAATIKPNSRIRRDMRRTLAEIRPISKRSVVRRARFDGHLALKLRA